MNYASIKNCDIANGEGVRVTLFVSGCTNHCENCFQPETWDFNYGQPFTPAVEDKLIEMLRPGFINGLTLLGGEPMEPQNQPAVLSLVRRFKEMYPEKDLWCFTGYLYDHDLLGRMVDQVPETKELLSYIDVLVDGPFIMAEKDVTLLFKGSANQRTIDVQKSLKAGEIIQWDPGEDTTISHTAHL